MSFTVNESQSSIIQQQKEEILHLKAEVSALKVEATNIKILRQSGNDCTNKTLTRDEKALADTLKSVE